MKHTVNTRLVVLLMLLFSFLAVDAADYLKITDIRQTEMDEWNSSMPAMVRRVQATQRGMRVWTRIEVDYLR